jgi:hypothetical protein
MDLIWGQIFGAWMDRFWTTRQNLCDPTKNQKKNPQKIKYPNLALQVSMQIK